jgi:2-C-methyl-D-erythritol 4-phosphate cytidylyltransferase
MNDVGLIIVAAGRGERLGHPEGKALVPVLGHPLLAWTLMAFDDFHQIVERVVVVPPGREEEYLRQVVEPLHLQRDVDLVGGGPERQDSVANGLEAMSGKAHWVVVHDAARPLVTPELIGRVLETLDGGECVVPALPVRDSVARIGFESWLKGYMDRSELLAVQTPQGFHRPVLEYAHQRARAEHFQGTDEASLLLRINHPVSWIEGEVTNFKITVPGDVELAEAVLVGRGYRREPS